MDTQTANAPAHVLTPADKSLPAGNIDDVRKYESIAHEWATLEELWRRIASTVVDVNEAQRIDALLKAADSTSALRHDWVTFNRAEQAVGAHLKGPELNAQFALLLRTAARRSLPSTPFYKERHAWFQEDATENAGSAVNDEEKRPTYLALLYELQSRFIDDRVERELRGRAATRILFTALIMTIAWIGACVFIKGAISWGWDGACGFSDATAVQCIAQGAHLGSLLIVIALLGATGAFFSRTLSFRTDLSGLDHESFTRDFLREGLWLRLIYGAMSAVIFYFVLRSGLVGDVLPDFPSTTAVADSSLSASNSDAEERSAASEQWLREFAKVVVWSFIAGFAERLVPNLLISTEARSSAQSKLA